jgi:hypothetical protein
MPALQKDPCNSVNHGPQQSEQDATTDMKLKAAGLNNEITRERNLNALGVSATCTARAAQVPIQDCRQSSVRLWIVALVIACVLPVWTAAGFLIYSNYQSRRALTEQRMLGTARALIQVLDRELAKAQVGLNRLATSPSLASDDLTAFLLTGAGGSGNSAWCLHYPYPFRRGWSATY